MRLFTTVILLFIYSTILSQSTWNLHECFERGKFLSAQIFRSELEKKMAEEEIKLLERNRFLPEINSGIFHGYNWGRSIDPFTNEFAQTGTRTNSLYVTGSIDIFNKFSLKNQSDQAKINLSITEVQLELEVKEVKRNIARLYISLIESYKLLELWYQEVESSEKIYDHMFYLNEAGHITDFELLSAKSKLSSDRYELKKQQLSYTFNRDFFKDLLNIPEDDSIDLRLSYPVFEVSEDTFNIDTLIQTHIFKLDLEHSKIGLKSLRAQRLPALTLQLAAGSGYSGNNVFVDQGTVMTTPFSKQLKQNFYQTAMLRLSIPILRPTLKQEIAMAKIKISQDSLMQLDEEKRIQQYLSRLLLQIKKSQIDLLNTQQMLSEKEELFVVANEKYLSGKITYLDLNAIKQDVLKAKKNKIDLELELWINRFNLAYF